VDSFDHAITDEEMATGTGRRGGRYTAVCGHEVLVTLMSCPPGTRCPRCVAYLRARATLRDFDQREQQPKRGLVARILYRVAGDS
jgi:hypothetical protein